MVLFTDTVSSPADPRSPEVVTVGSDDAWIFSSGRVVTGRWERADEGSSFSLRDAAGRPVRLTAGRTWIELVAPGNAEILPPEGAA